jgi:hypothetical protein
MAVRTNAADAAKNWVSSLGQAGTKITQGVQAVQQAPGAAAAAKKAKWLQNVQASADKWATRVQSVSLNDWQQAMITKGIPRIASGAAAAEPKFTSFMNEFLPFLSNVTDQTNRMPDTSFEERITKMVAQVRAVRNFKRSGS